MIDTNRDYFERLKVKNIHILGFLGREGLAVLNCLYNNGVKNIHAHDFSDKNEAQKRFNLIQTALNNEEKRSEYEKLMNKTIDYHFKDTYLSGIEKADVVFVSQNWYTYKVNEPLNRLMNTRDVTLTSLMDMYFELCQFPIIGITGSNGKTTTTNIIYQLLKASTDKKIFIAGNDMFAKPVIEDILDYSEDEAVLVLEISNRHLKNFTHKPNIAVLTNLTPNHLAEHGGWEGYVHDKANLFRHMDDGYTILNNDDPNTSLVIDVVRNQPVFFSKIPIDKPYSIFPDRDEIVFIDNGVRHKICSINDIPIPGEHNLENSLAGLAASILMGARISMLNGAMRSYKPVIERLQPVATLNGVQYYNDISCTTPISAEYAIKTLSTGKKNIIHIVGGEDKQMDFTNLNKLINKEVKKLIAFPGDGTDRILQGVNSYLVKHFDDIRDALEYIYNIAEKGDIVLLSPACAFFKREYIEPLKFDDYVFELIEKKKDKV